MCLFFIFSNMATTEYLYIVDLDEFIVPREINTNTTKKLLEKAATIRKAPSSKEKQPDALLFRNTFFCSEFNKEVIFNKEFDIFNIIKRQVSFFWYFI